MARASTCFQAGTPGTEKDRRKNARRCSEHQPGGPSDKGLDYFTTSDKENEKSPSSTVQNGSGRECGVCMFNLGRECALEECYCAMFRIALRQTLSATGARRAGRKRL